MHRKFRCGFLLLTAVLSILLMCILPLSYAGPDESASVQCPHDQAPFPFTGIYLCEDFHPRCAAVASVFTWYADDSSVDAGYERAKSLFVPTGWRDMHTGQPERPSTYDFMSIMPPLQMVPIWEQIHRAHHSAISYVLIDPSQYWVSVTQFEFLSHQLDRNGLPLAGIHPLRTRQWMVLESSAPTPGSGQNSLYLVSSIYTFGFHQGALIKNDRDTSAPTTYHRMHPLVTFPRGKQTLAQRWSCQGYFRG